MTRSPGRALGPALLVALCAGALSCTPAPPSDAGVDAGDRTDAGSTADGWVADEDGGQHGLEAGVIGAVEVMEYRYDSDTSTLTSYVMVQGLYRVPSPGFITGVCDRWLHDVADQSGPCRYLVSAIQGYCEPACDPWSHYCDVSDECVAFPERQSCGTLSLSGLNAAVTLTPSASNVYMLQETLPADLFSSGAQVTLSTGGGQIPAFEISATGVAELEPPLACDFDLQSDQDLVVTWTAAPGGARVQWMMNVGMHIGYGPMILCETDDTGSLTVPAALIARYLSDRWISSETFTLKRFSRQVVELSDGRQVVLLVSSSRICDFR